jgi:DnaJ-class molecular chaperone
MERINRAWYCLGEDDRKQRYDSYGEEGVGTSAASEQQLKEAGGKIFDRDQFLNMTDISKHHFISYCICIASYKVRVWAVSVVGQEDRWTCPISSMLSSEDREAHEPVVKEGAALVVPVVPDVVRMVP